MAEIERKILLKAHPAQAGEPDPAQLGKDGSFTGYAATFGNRDLVDDVIERGAFDEIGFKGAAFPLLDHHKVDAPLGLITVSQMSDGLWAYGRPNMDVARARELVSLLRQGAVSGLSIGYTVKDSYRKGSVRHLTKVELHEVSICTFPANPKARVQSVKAYELQETVRLLRDIRRDLEAQNRRRAA